MISLKYKVNFYIILSILGVLLFQGCASRPQELPRADSHLLPWGAIDLNISNTQGIYTIRNSVGTAIAQKADDYNTSSERVPFNILTLSGGGARGAYGAGLIYGWSERGNMPEFDIITGISTGAIMSIFIFAGGDELKKIKKFYTTLTTEDIYTSSIFSFFSSVTINDTEPFRQLLASEIDDKLLSRVAKEYAKGRRLYIGTTNLDTGQLVVWDMGAIASSNRKDKLQHYRDIVYASSAIPILFAPQFFEVPVNDKPYYQMHVDGGIYSYVFMIGLFVNWDEVLDLKEDAKRDFDVTLYAVANRKYRQRHEYTPAKQNPTEVIRALLLTETDLLFDRSMYRLYKMTIDRGFKFRMATVPTDIDLVKLPTQFNPDEMSKLFDIGCASGINGYQWKDKVKLDEYDIH